ncbi:YjeF N-terminal domain-containing protein [Pelagophyceae sp. CCMP2097]|nr:YjeF N-terminal domain-containing protein [Pelagophyceae sp. CCMP2097]
MRLLLRCVRRYCTPRSNLSRAKRIRKAKRPGAAAKAEGSADRTAVAASRAADFLDFKLQLRLDARILIVAGGGSTGLVAIALASSLIVRGYRRVHISAAVKDVSCLSPAARDLLREYESVGGWSLDDEGAMAKDSVLVRLLNEGVTLVIDGLLGHGAISASGGYTAHVIERLNSQPAPVLSLDEPSGIASQTSDVSCTCVCATYTLAFNAPSAGVLAPRARWCVGALFVADDARPLCDLMDEGRTMLLPDDEALPEVSYASISRWAFDEDPQSPGSPQANVFLDLDVVFRRRPEEFLPLDIDSKLEVGEDDRDFDVVSIASSISDLN